MSIRPLLDGVTPAPSPLLSIRTQSVRVEGDLLVGEPPVNIGEAVDDLAAAVTGLVQNEPVAYQPPGAGDFWQSAGGAATGSGELLTVANSRIIVSGSGTGIFWVGIAAPAPTVIAAVPTAGVLSGLYVTAWDPVSGLIVARDYTTAGCWRSLDNGTTFTQVPGVTGIGQGGLQWDPVAQWFIASVFDPGFAIQTSPDGLVWTSRPTPAGFQFGRIVIGAPRQVISVSVSNGPCWSADSGVTWAVSFNGIESRAIAASPSLVLVNPFVTAADYYVSTDGGQTFSVAVNSNAAQRASNCFEYFPELRRFYIVSVEGSTGGAYISTLPDVVTDGVYKPTGALALSGLTTISGGTTIYSMAYDPLSRRFAMGGNAGSITCWYTSGGSNVNLVAAAGSGSSLVAGAGGYLAGNALVLQEKTPSPVVLPTGASIYVGNAAQLLWRPQASAFSYPLGTFSRRFDATLLQTLYVDAFGSWNWNPAPKQLIVIPVANNFYSATNLVSSAELFTGTGGQSEQTFSSLALVAGTSLFAASLTTVVDNQWNATAATPTRLAITIIAGAGPVTSTLPIYSINILTTPSGNQANIIIRRDYQFV
jgi:hypothetical protein